MRQATSYGEGAGKSHISQRGPCERGAGDRGGMAIGGGRRAEGEEAEQFSTRAAKGGGKNTKQVLVLCRVRREAVSEVLGEPAEGVVRRCLWVWGQGEGAEPGAAKTGRQVVSRGRILENGEWKTKNDEQVCGARAGRKNGRGEEGKKGRKVAG
jgi:hypothetical protein